MCVCVCVYVFLIKRGKNNTVGWRKKQEETDEEGKEEAEEGKASSRNYQS